MDRPPPHGAHAQLWRRIDANHRPAGACAPLWVARDLWLARRMSIVTFQDLCLDALDVPAQARFWAAASGLDIADLDHPGKLVGSTSRHTVRMTRSTGRTG